MSPSRVMSRIVLSSAVLNGHVDYVWHLNPSSFGREVLSVLTVPILCPAFSVLVLILFLVPRVVLRLARFMSVCRSRHLRLSLFIPFAIALWINSS